MNEFENELIIRDEAYQNSFFPKVPKAGKRGSAYILTGGCDNDIIVDDHTTPKQIRQGKYTHLVEISTLPYIKEIKFQSPSKEMHYSFEVYVKAVIQVSDPITFYENKNIDVDAYFENLFSLDVRRITRGYSILNYNGLDEDLTQKLSSYNTVDEATGFSYQISVVDAMPGENAQEYVKKYGQQQLDAEMKKIARNLAGSFSVDYREAIMTEVAEGKLTELEAIQKIREYENTYFEDEINRLDELRKKGLITDSETSRRVIPVLNSIGANERTYQQGGYLEQADTLGMDEFYTEEKEK